LDALARAYYKSGKLGPAKARYEKIASTGLFRFEPDIWVKSFYWLGRIAEDRGKKSEARGHYEKFLDLWKDADPGLPEVEDARKRLAGLT
jgi:tetratricopeptide (TPR) repeat protein